MVPGSVVTLVLIVAMLLWETVVECSLVSYSVLFLSLGTP